MPISRTSGIRSIQVLALLFGTLGAEACLPAQCNPVWSPLGSGILQGNAEGKTVMVQANGDLILGGRFAVVGQQTARGIARWNGTTWSPFASGLTPSGVEALTQLHNGDVIAGGAFTNSGTASVPCIARWDGIAWHAIGGGLIGTVSGGVHALLTRPNGNVVAGGGFAGPVGGPLIRYLAEWDGTSWSSLGSPNGQVLALAAAANGDLIVGGNFTAIGGISANRIARFDGNAWSAMGTAMQPGVNDRVYAVATTSNGDVFAAGDFTVAGGTSVAHVARWNGTSWSDLAGGLTHPTPGEVAAQAIAVLPNDDVVVAGHFMNAGAIAADNVARWDGAAWHPVGGGTDGRVRGMATTSNGDVFATGWFLNTGSGPASRVARHTSCAALAATYGSGCSGSQGLQSLAASNLPRAGGTFVAEATNIPNNSLVLAVNGFTQLAIPLPAVLPQGVAGCTALVTPDFATVVTASAGVATTSLMLPNTATALGFEFRQQVVTFDLSTPALMVTSTNGLALTVGL